MSSILKGLIFASIFFMQVDFVPSPSTEESCNPLLWQRTGPQGVRPRQGRPARLVKNRVREANGVEGLRRHHDNNFIGELPQLIVG